MKVVVILGWKEICWWWKKRKKIQGGDWYNGWVDGCYWMTVLLEALMAS
jgi:hypothetical protein